MSSVLPGAGQLAKGHYVKAAEVFALGVMLGAAWYFGYAFDGPFTPFLLYSLPLAAVFWWGRQVHDAYASVSVGSLVARCYSRARDPRAGPPCAAHPASLAPARRPTS